MKVLYILPSYNLYGGTPKKTLDLIAYRAGFSAVYIYSDEYSEFRCQFEAECNRVYEAAFGRNILRHLQTLLRIIDTDSIKVVQTQFFFGELLGGVLKVFRPQIKLVNCFVGPASPTGVKYRILSWVYKQVDAFVYVSNYVKREKQQKYSVLSKKQEFVIYNSASARVSPAASGVELKHIALLSVAGLTTIKNVGVLIDAVEILDSEEHIDFHLYVAGDGPERRSLQMSIREKNLEDKVMLLGYQECVGDLLRQCDIFLHSCYMEGFGIAVAEAMFAEKPLVVANSGALPELIENEVSGLTVDPFDPEQWAEAIIRLTKDSEFSSSLALSARKRADKYFSIDKYAKNYEHLYDSLADRI
jgi:glycosyltransferase involved in cell wall biosynthesis